MLLATQTPFPADRGARPDPALYTDLFVKFSRCLAAKISFALEAVAADERDAAFASVRFEKAKTVRQFVTQKVTMAASQAMA